MISNYAPLLELYSFILMPLPSIGELPNEVRLGGECPRTLTPGRSEDKGKHVPSLLNRRNPCPVRLPSQAPRSSGGCRQRRLGGCTIVQVENELKGKIIPGSSGAAGEGTNCTFDSKFP